MALILKVKLPVRKLPQACLSTLLNKTVIIRHNVFQSPYKNSKCIDGRYAPYLGKIGEVTEVTGYRLKVYIPDMRCEKTFSHEYLFYLRERGYIITYINDRLINFFPAVYGERAYRELQRLAFALQEHDETEALLLANESVFAYHFLTWLTCPQDFPQPIQDPDIILQR